MATARGKLVASTQTLMLERGYASTGVDDICGHAGVSKGAFYHSFSSKEQLAVEALEGFYADGLRFLLSIDVSAAAPEDKLLAFLNVISEQGAVIWKRGCLIGGLASEMAASNATMQRHVSRTFSDMVIALAPLAEPFAATLQSRELTAPTIMEHFLVIVEGAVVMSRAHRDHQRITQAVLHFATFLRALPRKAPITTKKPKPPITPKPSRQRISRR